MNKPASAAALQRIADFGSAGFETIAAASFADGPAPERQEIVPGLIPDRNVTDLSGDGGLGKSMISLQLGIATSTGTDWLGYMPTPGAVLYVSCEDEIAEIHRRIEIIARHRSLRLSDLTGLHLVDLTNAAETELAAPNGKSRIALTPLYQTFVATIDRLRPKLAIVDTRADVFGGDEISRHQVRFFVRALRRVCFEYDMAILLLSHPSLTGMSTGSGQSGSTAWGNSVRSRLYLERPKADDGTEPDSNLRLLTTKKMNYGPADTSIMLRWENGIFRPEGATASTIDRIARDQSIESRFLELLRDFDKQGRHVNPNSGSNYAPKAFAAADTGTIGHRQFKAAMDRLFAAGKIAVAPNGPPSRGSNKIVEVTA